jgi:hypothetical protein
MLSGSSSPGFAIASEQTIPEDAAAAESLPRMVENWAAGGLFCEDQPNERKSKGEGKTVTEAFDAN